MRPNANVSSAQLEPHHPDDFGVPPPSYEKAVKSQSRWNPKSWSKKTRILAVLALVTIIIIVVVVGAVEGTNDSSYPDYSPLNYQLQDTYAGAGFFDDFDFFTGYDPTHGLVHYVPEAVANSTQFNLTYADADSATLRVDTSSDVYNTANGRYSVRITSKKQYDSGLFVFDVLHSPYGCSTWPAVWLTDPSNWPQNGEIDVIEAVNQANTGNQMTLHTTSGCKISGKRKQTGHALARNCDADANSGSGCGVKGPQATYGAALNANGGGTFAMEWRSAGIRMWFFARGSEPADLPSNIDNTTAPDPSTWGEALADFPSTHCDIGKHFTNQSIIANVDLCGDWAGSEEVYSTQDQCPGTCADFVASNSTAYETAFWEFRSWRVYTVS